MYRRQLMLTGPMITEAFMRDVAASATGEVTTAIPLPSAFPEAGYYPTSYTTQTIGDDLQLILPNTARSTVR